MARIILTSAPDPLAYDIVGEVFTIGGAPGADLVLADSMVEPWHAEIRRDGGRYRIVDVSGEAMLVNRLSVVEEWLAHGDIIAIGLNEMLFEDADLVKKIRAFHPALSESTGVKPDQPVRFSADIKLPDKDPDYQVDAVVSLDELRAKPPHGLDASAEAASRQNLSSLYRISRAINSSTSMAATMEMTLTLILRAAKAECGAVFTIDGGGKLAPMVARRRDGSKIPPRMLGTSIVKRAIEDRAAIVCSDACYFIDDGDDVQGIDGRREALSVLCVPLLTGEAAWGAVYLDNEDERSAFSMEDVEFISSIADQLALMIERERTRERVQESRLFQATLERFHSPDVARAIIDQAGREDGFSGLMKEREVTILFADISGFTTLLEQLAPREAALLLNRFFDEMTAIVFKYHGTVDKFIGDAVMANFGAPISYGADAELAVFAAIEMMRNMRRFRDMTPMRQWFEIRIGINTGVVVSGYVGSRRRLDYTVLGDPVNVAARIQEMAGPGQILIGESAFAKVSGVFEHKDLGTVKLRGKSSETRIYEINYKTEKQDRG